MDQVDPRPVPERDDGETGQVPGRRPGGGRRWAGATGRDLLAGAVTALFSVPEAMAYAAVAGLDIGSGLDSGVWPAVAGSLLAGTPLMITTLTSTIALTSGKALRHAHLDPALPSNVAALTLLVAVAMAVFALLGLGSLLRGVSVGAMTGFSLGIAVQIVSGAVRDATGYRCHHHNRLLRLASWLAHPGAWSYRATAVAAVTLLLWAAAHAVARLRALAVLVALGASAALVHLTGVTVPLAASLGALPAGLPQLTLPDWQVMPHLVGGACSVAVVGLAQAAAITPGPKEGEAARCSRRDVLAQAAANLLGAFCHALPAGGSPSRTAVAVSAGARTRWAGVVSGLALAGLLCFFGRATGSIPLAVIGALLILVGVKLALARLPEVRLSWRHGWRERTILAATFLAASQVPLQYALLLAVLLSGAARAPMLLAARGKAATAGPSA